MAVRRARCGSAPCGDEAATLHPCTSFGRFCRALLFQLLALGRAFLADYVKGLLPADVEADFVREFSLDYSQIVCKVYKEQAASAFMASFAPFILSHSHDPYIKILIQECLESFVKRSLARYAASAEDAASASKVGVVGSFGCACEDMLRQIGERYGIEFVKFIKSPVEELVKYHSNNGL